MRIEMVVGSFPQLSETFIFRKAVALASRGHHVTILARQQGEWSYFRKYLPLPETLSVKYAAPDWGFSDPRRLLQSVARTAYCFLQSPALPYRLSLLYDRREPNGDTKWRSVIRHLPLAVQGTDLIHFENLSLAAMYGLAFEFAGGATVVSCRGADVHLLSQESDILKSKKIEALRRAAAIHCVTQEMAQEVFRLTGRVEGIWVNRPAVPVEQICAKQSYEHAKPPLMIAVGRLVWKKGLDYLVTALGQLKRSGIPFKAQIIGDGPLYAPLRFSIEDMSLQSEVRLTGALPPDEVLKRIQAADIFVLSSHEEGISNAALEAMASGLPVVTTNAGGMAEAVRDGQDGYVVPVRDIAAMADRLTRLLTNPGLREQMGRAARRRVESEFSIERQATEFEKMYEWTLTGRRN